MIDGTALSIQTTINSKSQIICTDLHSCRDSTIKCPTNSHCEIICSGQNSCQRIQIDPPQNKSLFNLIYNGRSALWSVNYPIYPLDDYQNYSLTCNKPHQCERMFIQCPIYGYCNINCTATQACYYVCYIFYILYFLSTKHFAINIQMDKNRWPIEPGKGNIICHGERACQFVTFPIPDPHKPYNLVCDSQGE